MKAILDLLSRLSKSTFKERYPEYKTDDGKIHVLYLACYANGTGFYRTVLPYLHLNETDTHAAIISNILSWDFENQEPITHLPDFTLLRWAHYVVFPTMMVPIKEWIHKMTCINNELMFVMDIDDNIHELNQLHPLYGKITMKQKRELVNNLSQMTLITSPNNDLLEYYSQKIEDEKGFCNADVADFPNLLSVHLFERKYFQDDQPKPENDKIKIGMIVNEVHAQNVYDLNPALRKIQKEYSDRIELINIGWNGMYKGKNYFSGLNIKYIPGVPFPQYFDLIGAQNFDFGIIPLMNKPKFNQYKAYQRWLEFSAFKVPVIIGNCQVYDVVQKYLYRANNNKEFDKHIRINIKDSHIVKNSIGWHASNFAWKENSWNEEAINLLTEIFE